MNIQPDTSELPLSPLAMDTLMWDRDAYARIVARAVIDHDQPILDHFVPRFELYDRAVTLRVRVAADRLRARLLREADPVHITTR